MNQASAIDTSQLVTACIADGLYKSLLTVSTPTTAKNSLGEDIPTGGSTALFTDVACQIGVPTGAFDRRAQTEDRTQNLTMVLRRRQVNISGYYPAIDSSMVATVDGTAYNILGVLHDSQHGFTELLVELITT